LLIAVCAAIPAEAKDAPRSFSLSTSRTFAPGESVKIQLLARNVPSLEFRVYKVKDEEKFFAGLKDLHSFGETNAGPEEKVDQETWLERLHDFKAHLWYLIRHFFRGQFDDDARDSIREGQGKLGKRSAVVGVSEFAQVPLLNESQLVARWKLVTPPALVSETQTLPVDGLGAGVYLIEATDGTFKAYTVAIVTSIAMVERVIGGETQVYVGDRKTGAPVAGAEIALWVDGNRQALETTGADGMAVVKKTAQKPGAQPEKVFMLARHGGESALVAPYSYMFDGPDDEVGSKDLTSYAYTDRPVYRPGHTVHIKGIMRKKKGDDLDLPDAGTVHLRVTDSDNKAVLDKDLPVSGHGTVTADLDLASDAGLGYYSISLMKDGKEIGGGGNFYVEEYKKPEYQVTVKPVAQRVLQGKQVQAVIEAKYFFGEPVANAKVTYVVATTPHFWWGDVDDDDQAENAAGDEGGDNQDYEYTQEEQQEHTGMLDANGRLTVTIPTREDKNQRDQDYRIEARVTDVGNREVSGHSTVLATFGSFRLIVEPVNYVLEQGQPVKVKVSAQDYDGKPVNTLFHLDVLLTKWDSSTFRSTSTKVSGIDSATSSKGTMLLTLPSDFGKNTSGDYTLKVTADTPEGRTIEDETWVWIWSGAGEFYSNRNTQAQIVADKKSYQVGDVAHLLLVSGVGDAWAQVTAEGETVQWKKLLHATGTTVAFDVPITRLAEPNLLINAVIVKDDKVITAQKSLKVPLVERTLTITATPNKTQYLPGEKGSFDVLAVDSAGKPVEADLSFGEVDEALYSVRPDESGNIVNAFYPRRDNDLEAQSSFEFYFSGEAGLKSPLLAQSVMFHPRLAQVKPGSDLVVPKVRKAFPDTAYWNPTVHTGPDGHAKVEFNFPDALTTWRTTIRGMTDDGKAGGMVTRVLVRKNLIVRLAAPRFFRQGDEVTLRVIAHNYLESAKDVTFALDVAGLEVVGGQTQKVNIPAKGESFVDWRVKAHATGNAVVTATALTNEESDALEMTLPVLPFGVKVRAAGSGVVFSGNGQETWNYTYPQTSDAGTRGLTISIAPSVAGTVFDALDYLTGYPWGCTEQTMSSFLPDVIVAQAVDKLHLKSPIDRKVLNDEVRSGLDRLYSFQHDDGGWGWWQEDQSTVFMTAYVVSGLGQAQGAGYKVDEQRLTHARQWLVGQLGRHPDMIPDLRAYVVYALATTGGAPKNELDDAWGFRDKLTDEGLALVGLALGAGNANGDTRAKQAAVMLEKKADTKDGDAHWSSNYDELMEYFGDTTPETTAFALKLIVAQDRGSGLMTKAASWLAKNRDGDYWFSTKQTSMVIQGLTDYLAVSGELANTSDVEVLVNGASVGKRHFGTGDMFAAPWRVKLAGTQAGAGGTVTIRKSGNGITYWGTESNWYSADKRLYQQEQLALNITRDYYVLAKKQDHPEDPITYDLNPLNGPVHVGDIVAVKLAVSGTNWKYLLAEDPIPAGTEFLDHTELYKLNNKPDWWADWFTRKEYHDDRAAFFNTDFSGRREYVYLLKVVNPGKFQMSPADAGPMYQSNVEATTDPATLEVQQ
jgi:uncharacterized protein YfaS (alpha-2-macroglobulin family)